MQEIIVTDAFLFAYALHISRPSRHATCIKTYRYVARNYFIYFDYAAISIGAQRLRAVIACWHHGPRHEFYYDFGYISLVSFHAKRAYSA